MGSLSDRVSIPSTLAGLAGDSIAVESAAQKLDRRLREQGLTLATCSTCGARATREEVAVTRPGEPTTHRVVIRCQGRADRPRCPVAYQDVREDTSQDTREEPPMPKPKQPCICQQCGATFHPYRPADYCSHLCRQRAYRARGRQPAAKPAETTPAPAPPPAAQPKPARRTRKGAQGRPPVEEQLSVPARERRKAQVLELLVSGLTVEETAATARLAVRTVKDYLADPDTRQALAELQAERRQDADRQLRGLVPKALKACEEILDDPKAPEWARLRAAENVLTRAGLVAPQVDPQAGSQLNVVAAMFTERLTVWASASQAIGQGLGPDRGMALPSAAPGEPA